MRSKHRAHRNMFSLAGWLFADMFLAMTMIFLIASAVGTYIPPKVVSHVTPTPRLIGMDNNPVSVTFTVDSTGLLNNDPAVVAQVKSEVQNQLKNYMKKHVNGKAAFVSTFGGGADDGTDTQEASNINAILRDLGKQKHYVFDRGDTIYKSYVDRSDNYGFVTLEIFFYLYAK